MKKNEQVTISLPDKKTLQGILHIPEYAEKIVVFSHGSGSGRFSPRNQYVAEILSEQKLATLLLDLLTEEEEAVDAIDGSLRFDISLLTTRLIDATRWLMENPKTKHLKVCFFGSSTGSAAALAACAKLPGKIAAIVSRGGRPDLAAFCFPKVYAPTLLLVGGNDFGVIELNEEAYQLLPCEKKLQLIPGATHLFEEPGTLEQVAKLAANWFISPTQL